VAGSLNDRVLDILFDWVQEKSDEMRESLVKHGHTDYSGSGDLYQSATVKPEWIQDEGGQVFRLKIVLPFYASFLNEGTDPSRKNPSPSFIESLSGGKSWISRKGISMPLKRTWTDATGKNRTQTVKNTVEANRSFAWALARKRLKYGYPGTHWFDEVWGGDPVPENGEAIKELQRLLLQMAGDAKFFIDIITDPNERAI